MKQGRLTDTLVFVIVPIAIALILVFLLVAEHKHIDQDLQLFVQAQARPGAWVAMRSMLLDEIDRPEGPRTHALTVDVRLVEQGRPARVLARARLRPTPMRTSEGDLHVPADARGPHWLIARAVMPDGTVAQVQAPLRIGPEARGAEVTGRLAMPLQRWVQYAVQTQGADPTAGPPPQALETRVVGGACAPETRCELLVLVGPPAAAVRIEPSGAVSPVLERGAVPQERVGVHALSVITHGPEAQVDVVATRGGREVARRPVRLPIALGSLALRADSAILEGEVVPHLRAEGARGRPGIILDGLRDGFWQRTGTVPTRRAGSDGFEPPWEPLGLADGRGAVWRVQARLDPFSADNAAVRLLYVRPLGEPRVRTIETVRAFARDHEIDDVHAAAAARDEPDVARVVAFILALGELDLIPQPRAMSGHAQAMTGVEGGKTWVRVLGLAALIVLALLVGLFAARRGLDAAAQARRVMEEAGDATAQDESRRRRMTLTVLMFSAAVLLAFLAVAAMVVARF